MSWEWPLLEAGSAPAAAAALVLLAAWLAALLVAARPGTRDGW